MNATASLPALNPAPAARDDQPIVLVNGAIEPRLRVRSFDMSAPLDHRRASLAVIPLSSKPSVLSHWFDAEFTVLSAMRLVDDQVRYAPLLCGRIDRQAHARRPARIDDRLDIVDEWSRRLGETIATTWWQTTDGLIHQQQGQAIMTTGDNPNRSADTWPIGITGAHVLQAHGQPWTTHTAIQTLAAFTGLEIATDLVPRTIRDAPLARPVDLSQPLGAALARVLEPYDLIVQRRLSFAQGRVRSRLAIRPAGRGRPVHLRWADDDQPLGEVLQVDIKHVPDAARQWIARAAGPVIESTFTLVPGWHPNREGQPDSEYSRETSTDWPQYANTYRYWVLNEDAHFTPAPYLRGQPFDLGAFFAQAPMPPRPLRFQDNLTGDDTGLRRPPLIQMSLDHGNTWTTYPGATRIDDQRAAVHLHDATLPAAFLTAAKTGAAAIRVTASLQSPKPLEVARWQGNPFAGASSPRILSVRDLFTFRQVSAQSIHHADVTSGALPALQSDPTRAMSQWLLDQIDLHNESQATRAGAARLTLSSANPLLQPGDRLFNSRAPGRDAAGEHEAVARQGATVVTVRRTWPDGETDGAGSQTLVDLHF